MGWKISNMKVTVSFRGSIFHWAHDYGRKSIWKISPDFVAPPQTNGSPGSSPDWFAQYPLWLAQLPCPPKPLAKQGSNQHYLGFCKPFLPQKNGFCCFFSRWWQLKYVQFSPRSLGKSSNFTRAYFFRWLGGSTHQLVLVCQLPLIFPKKSPNLP